MFHTKKHCSGKNVVVGHTPQTEILDVGYLSGGASAFAFLPPLFFRRGLVSARARVLQAHGRVADNRRLAAHGVRGWVIYGLWQQRNVPLKADRNRGLLLFGEQGTVQAGPDRRDYDL